LFLVRGVVRVETYEVGRKLSVVFFPVALQKGVGVGGGVEGVPGVKNCAQKKE
jgi:hypothetical protein